MWLQRGLFYLTSLAVCSHWVLASGFSILELGGRAAGMGGAFTAIANDGSALFYNPAGIAFQPGFRFEADGFIDRGYFHFTPSTTPPGTIVPKGGYSGVVSPAIQFLGNLFVTKQISQKWTFGLGVYSPFGLGDNWTNFKDSDPANTKFVGRFAGTRGLLQNIWAQPTIAYRVTEKISIAVGPALVYNHLLLERSILNPLDDGAVFGQSLAPLLLPTENPALAGLSIARFLPEGRARFDGQAFSPGVTAGGLIKFPSRKTSLGASWRSPVTYHVAGIASFGFTNNYTLQNLLPALGAPSLSSLFPNQDIKASYTTPGTLNVGIANSSFWKSTLAFDFVFQNYNRFNTIALNFSKTQGTATPPVIQFPFNFRDTYFLRAGWERRIKPNTIVRAGYYFDHAGVPDASVSPFFPDSSKNVITGGISRHINNKEITFFYQGAFEEARNINVPANEKTFTNGRYRVFINLFGFGVRMRKGTEPVETDR